MDIEILEEMQIDLDPEIIDLVSDNFWELLAEDNDGLA